MTTPHRTRLSATVLTFALAAALAACTSDEAPTPTVTSVPSATASAEATEEPTTAAVPAVEMIGDLPLPEVGPLAAPTGPGVDVFGADHAMQAYRFAIAFSTRVNAWPEIWAVEPLTPDVFLPLEVYQAGGQLTAWRQAVPDFVAGTGGNPGGWQALFFYPVRQPDGTAPPNSDPTVPETTAGAPWLTGVDVGPAVVDVHDDAQFGQVIAVTLDLRFDVVSAGPDGPEWITPTTRHLTYYLTPNPDEAGRDRAPLVITGIDWSTVVVAEAVAFPG